MVEFIYKSQNFSISGFSKSDHIYKKIEQQKTFYEIDLLEYIQAVIQTKKPKERRTVAIDVGANIGNHSIFFNSFIADQVISIEPNPETLPILKNNLSQNAQDYTILEMGLGEKKCTGQVYLPSENTNNIGSAKISIENSNDNNIVISTLDSELAHWLENHTGTYDVSLIKVDVEGMELSVLKGAVETIKKYTPNIFIEAASQNEISEISAFLSSLNYRRLPYKWAATPTYHFAHKATLKSYLLAHSLKLLQKLKKIFR